MSGRVVALWRGIIAMALVGSLAVQGIIVFLVGSESPPERTGTTWALRVILVLGIVSLQVVGVAVWRLVGRIRHGRKFSPAALRDVDLITGSFAAGSVLVLGIALLGAYLNRATPGGEVAPGVLGIVGCAALVVAGIALVVHLLRRLVVQVLGES